MTFFEKRKLRKLIKEHLHAARHARYMREDIADPNDLQALAEAEAVVKRMRESGSGELEPALEALAVASDKVYPTINNSGARENVEVIIVALGAAMAIRAFFAQPYKIPTGSMQPTLNGITTEAKVGGDLTDKQPIKFVKWLLTGTSYKEFRAKATGQVTRDLYGSRDKLYIDIAGVPHAFPAYMKDELIAAYQGGRMKPVYKEGDLIASAKVIAGDHIIVNKMKYNFMHPERGDISVFDTKHIGHPDVRKDTFYIKRMVGLPGEKMQIQNRRIVADGQVVFDPPIFEKIATDPMYNGGHDVTPGAQLSNEDRFIQLGDDEYLMCGDNTQPGMSLDGRFFGGVPHEDFQGPAFFVYWPFREHWGIVK